MEKLIERPRHIEFQVLGDRHGNVMHLGERECSLQRRHQKVLRGIAVDGASTQRLGSGSATQVVDALTKIGYSSAGTVEFLREESGKLYFIEMNARIQVEHPVTEMVTGVDLVKSQIRVAAGEKLETWSSRSSFAATPSNAASTRKIPKHLCLRRDASLRFAFPAGRASALILPCYADAVIPPYYDSLIAKMIALRPQPRRSDRPHERRAGRLRGGRHQDHDSAAQAEFWPIPTSSPESSTRTSSNGR